MDISSIHWHDTQIQRVSIDPESDRIQMSVLYPVDWDSDDYRPRTLQFDGARAYQCHEGDCVGMATILDASIIETVGQSSHLRLETTHGYQLLWCSDVHVI